jgi:hypothetical protein
VWVSNQFRMQKLRLKALKTMSGVAMSVVGGWRMMHLLFLFMQRLDLDTCLMAMIDDNVRSFRTYWRYCLFSWMTMSSYRRLLCFLWSG